MSNILKQNKRGNIIEIVRPFIRKLTYKENTRMLKKIYISLIYNYNTKQSKIYVNHKIKWN